MNIKQNHRVSLLYILTLIMALTIPISMFDKGIHTWLIILMCVGLGILHFIVFLCITLYIEQKRDNVFLKEYHLIYDTYKTSGDAQYLYDHLKAITRLPKSEERKVAYYINLSTAAYKTKRYEEAFALLENIDFEVSQELQSTIKQQRVEILKQLDKKG